LKKNILYLAEQRVAHIYKLPSRNSHYQWLKEEDEQEVFISWAWLYSLGKSNVCCACFFSLRL
jgi:hypothetical protein